VTQSGAVFLESAAAEIEAHVGAAGWDGKPTLFALVRAARFAVDEPETAARLGLDRALGDALTPIEQEGVPDGPLDEVLAQISWPASVAGCALSQEIVILPPTEDEALPRDTSALAVAAAHPLRREARLVVAVLRDGSSAAVLRLRRGGNTADTGDNRTPDATDDLLTGPDLAPNLVDALVATLTD
jgi:hypothetical protein